MAVETHKLGPGSLTLGSGAAQFAQQLRQFEVTPTENVTTEDDIEVLSGETVTGEDTVTHEATVSGKILQDLGAAGFVAYTWENNGQVVPFTFKPKTGLSAAVTGTVRILAVKIGGEVKTRMESDFSWSCTGFPTFTPHAP